MTCSEHGSARCLLVSQALAVVRAVAIRWTRVCASPRAPRPGHPLAHGALHALAAPDATAPTSNGPMQRTMQHVASDAISTR